MGLNDGGLRAGGLRNVTRTIPDSAILRWKINEGSGTTVADSINNYDGSIVGGTWVSDSGAVGGYEIDLDGTDDAIDKEIRDTWDYTAGVLTIDPDSWDTSGFDYLSDGEGDSTGNNSHSLRQNGGSMEFIVRVGGSWYILGTTNLPSTGTKTRIGYRYDGSSMDLFYNGGSEATQSQSGALDNWIWNGVGRRKYAVGGSTITDRHADMQVDNPILFATNTASELPDDQWFTNDYNDQPWS